MFKVEDKVFNAIAQYLIERPYKDVAHLLAAIQVCDKINEQETELETESSETE